MCAIKESKKLLIGYTYHVAVIGQEVLEEGPLIERADQQGQEEGPSRHDSLSELIRGPYLEDKTQLKRRRNEPKCWFYHKAQV
jgi:hypothetical protein